MKITELSVKMGNLEYMVIKEQEIWLYILTVIQSLNRKEIQTKTITGIKVEIPCSFCKNTGALNYNICSVCDGLGRWEEEVTEIPHTWKMIEAMLSLHKIGIEKKI